MSAVEDGGNQATATTPAPQTNTIPAHWLYEGEHRLDGRYYGSEAATAQRLVSDAELPVVRVEELAEEIFAAPISRRHYTNQGGTPYLTPTEVYHFRPAPEKMVVKRKLRDPDRWMVEAGWILITQSGSVGRVRIATKRLTEAVISQNLLRLVPRKKTRTGYLLAFLASPTGQALLTRDRYGAAVKHLDPHHIGGVPTALPPEATQKKISDLVMKAVRLRDEANDLLDAANALVYSELGLPEFSLDLVEHLPPPEPSEDEVSLLPRLRSFSTPALKLQNRLDASFHVPISKTAIRVLEDAFYDTSDLGAMADRVYIPPRFKRIYVPEAHGVPFLQGSHLPLMRPFDIKYLSPKKTPKIERWIVESGWVMVTCSGTIGRIGVVTSYQDGWAASQHILRIVAKEGVSHPGYIAAFLETPYGQHQLKSKIYGGVVDELTEEDTRAITIPAPPLAVQERIGEKVVEAYEKRDEANALDDRAITEVTSVLEAAQPM